MAEAEVGPLQWAACQGVSVQGLPCRRSCAQQTPSVRFIVSFLMQALSLPPLWPQEWLASCGPAYSDLCHASVFGNSQAVHLAQDYSSDATVDLSSPQLAQTGQASPDTADTLEVSPENMPDPLQRLRAQGAQSLAHAMESECLLPASAGVGNSAGEPKRAEPPPASATVAIQQSGPSVGQDLLAAMLDFHEGDDDL